MTDVTAAEMGRRSNRLERQRLGENEYLRRRRERARLGGLAARGRGGRPKGSKNKPKKDSQTS